MSRLKDYIALSTDEFENKYGDEAYDETRELARKTNYNASLVIPIMREERERRIADGATEQEADKNIRRILKRKAFSEEFISRYITALQGTKVEGFGDLIETFDITYYGEPLKASDLEGELNTKKLVIPEGMEDVIKQTIKTLNIDEKYQGAIEQILSELDKPKDMISVSYSPADIVDTINPVKTEDRKEFYDFWEEIHPLFDDLYKAVENVIRDWQGVSKELNEEGGYKEEMTLPEPLKESDEFVELEKEMIALTKLFKKMKGMNYVAEVEPLSFKLHSRHDDEIHINVIEMIKDEILSLPIFDAIDSDPGLDEEDDEVPEPSPTFEGEDDEQGGGQTNIGGTPDFDPHGNLSPNAIHQIERAEKLYKTIHHVDPLTAVAQMKNKFKRGAFTSRTYTKFIAEMESQMKDLGSMNPDMIDQLWELMEDLKEAEEELVEVSQEEYHVPLTSEMTKVLNMSREEKIDNIADIDDFHEKLLDAVQDIVETEDDKSMSPWITEFIDTRESVSSEYDLGDEAGESTPRMARYQTGKTGMPRPLGKYMDSITELLRIINEYYVVPAHSHFLPFETIPKHLDSKFLSQIKIAGPDSLYQLLEFGFYSTSAQMIDMHEINHINEYLDMMKNPTEIDMKDAVIISEKLLDVLDDIFDERFKENDKKLLSKVLVGIANKNNVEAKDITLEGESIVELSKGYSRKKHTSSYFLLIKLLRHYKDLFLKDSKKKEPMEKFYELLEGVRNPLLLSQQRDILIAHDEIRKMSDKPIHYAYKNLDDYDDINNTIDLIKSKYKQDITATDITSIVTEFDSINSISKKHGLGEEVIYHIKGLYR